MGLFGSGFTRAACIAGALMGGTANPLYALLIAYANDYIAREDMAAASGGFLFINGVGAIIGPIALGWLMGVAAGPRPSGASCGA